MRKTKIIATLGPASRDEKIIEQMINAGVNIFRINFSHAIYENIDKSIFKIRKLSKKLKKPVAILADLKGPEIRTDQQTYSFKIEDKIILVTEKGNPQKNEIGISHKTLYKLVKKGQNILADDGMVGFNIIQVIDEKIICKVKYGQRLTSNKSINVPGIDIKLPILSSKDKKDLDYICQQDFDWLAISFVNSAKDIQTVKKYIAKQKKELGIISKIEAFLSIRNIDEIIDNSDGIMIARGDLGVEFPVEEVPFLQEEIIYKTQKKSKIVIVATQMLEHMTNSPYPTRSEVNDIYTSANANVDAVMLSGETASGKYPVLAVKTMAKIIRKSERENAKKIHYDFDEIDQTHLAEKEKNIFNICKVGLNLSIYEGSKFFTAISKFGKSAKIISSFRKSIPVIVICLDKKLINKFIFYYGIYPIYIEKLKDLEYSYDILEAIKKEFIQKKILKKEEHFICCYSHPISSGVTNAIRRL